VAEAGIGMDHRAGVDTRSGKDLGSEVGDQAGESRSWIGNEENVTGVLVGKDVHLFADDQPGLTDDG
jgi:hypothetical protein